MLNKHLLTSILWYCNTMFSPYGVSKTTWSSPIVDLDLLTSVMTSWNPPFWKFQIMISLEWVVRSTSCLILDAYCQQRANHIASGLFHSVFNWRMFVSRRPCECMIRSHWYISRLGDRDWPPRLPWQPPAHSSNSSPTGGAHMAPLFAITSTIFKTKSATSNVNVNQIFI